MRQRVHQTTADQRIVSEVLLGNDHSRHASTNIQKKVKVGNFYMSQTQVQQRFIILEVAADWHAQKLNNVILQLILCHDAKSTLEAISLYNKYFH